MGRQGCARRQLKYIFGLAGSKSCGSFITETVQRLFSLTDILTGRRLPQPPNLSAARPSTATMYHTITPLLLRRVILAAICATGTLSAKNPPQPAPTPDPALELSPTQDDQIQRINNLFAQQEEPLSDALKKARKDYKRAINAHPVDNATVQEKAAAVDKAAAMLATAEALHRANVLILLTPEQRKMVATFELTGKVPGNPAKKKSTDTGN
jgi:Spy/CpxP family protein refolding chaperone